VGKAVGIFPPLPLSSRPPKRRLTVMPPPHTNENVLCVRVNTHPFTPLESRFLVVLYGFGTGGFELGAGGSSSSSTMPATVSTTS